MSEARVPGSERTPHASPRREQSQERVRGVPGKRTLTQSLSRSADAPAPPPSPPVQRRGKTLAELTDDPCMDAAHRGAGQPGGHGILDEVYALIQAGAAKEMCAALALLLEAATRARDTAQVKRIEKTQKAKDCRHSRHS